MLMFILVLLIVLWLLGYVQLPMLPFLNIVLFTLNGQPITVLNLLVFFVILWLIGILPTPFREIAGAIFIIWLLALFGIIAISGFSQVVLVGLILGIVIFIIGGF